METAQQHIKRIAKDWSYSGEETISDVIAERYNTDPSDVMIDKDGSVHSGTRWLSATDINELIDWMHGHGYLDGESPFTPENDGPPADIVDV